ncbi:MAG: VOC family protein [Aureispira sp.]
MNLNQITVPVLNISKSIAFYEQLGLELIVHSTNHYARFECPTGDATFSLHQVETLPIGGGVWVYFEVEELEQEVKRLLDIGMVFEALPIDQPWLWKEARLKDLDGNQLILFCAGSNRKNPPWRINKTNHE